MAALGSVLITRSLHFHGLWSLTSFSAVLCLALTSFSYLLFFSCSIWVHLNATPHSAPHYPDRSSCRPPLSTLHLLPQPRLGRAQHPARFHNVSLSTGPTLSWSSPQVTFHPKASNNGDCHFQDPKFSLPGVFPDPPEPPPHESKVSPWALTIQCWKVHFTDLSPS